MPLIPGLGIVSMVKETGQPASELNSEDENKLKAGLLSIAEGRLLLAGVALALIYTFWLGIKFLLSPEESQILIGMTATEIMFGRAAGMAFGYSQGLEHITVIPVCMMIETATHPDSVCHRIVDRGLLLPVTGYIRTGAHVRDRYGGAIYAQDNRDGHPAVTC